MESLGPRTGDEPAAKGAPAATDSGGAVEIRLRGVPILDTTRTCFVARGGLHLLHGTISCFVASGARVSLHGAALRVAFEEVVGGERPGTAVRLNGAAAGSPGPEERSARAGTGEEQRRDGTETEEGWTVVTLVVVVFVANTAFWLLFLSIFDDGMGASFFVDVADGETHMTAVVWATD
ncbi:hypothetical protein HU200_059027 [Digitaria exilis]|uniref:Uncharacterized protein n=1 Tax=Digitaria exilis TaxID=1010633 RepID=A0A835A8H0_9POAL|nr:hypothetical protein HU200_059027 [Digitaria exilis]